MNVLFSVVLLKINLYLHYLLTITQKINSKHKRNCCTQPAGVYRRPYCHWAKIAALFTINVGIYFMACVSAYVVVNTAICVK